MDLADLAEALDLLVAGDPGVLASAEDLVVLERQRSRLEAVVARAATRFEAEEAYAADGARTAAAWLATCTHLPRREVRSQLGLGRALRELPRFEEALLEGSVGAAHVRCVARLLGPRTREAVRKGEAFLVLQAQERTFAEFERIVAYLAQVADPDGAEEAAEARRARRDVWLAPGFDGSYLGKIELDPVAGAIVAGELARLADEAYAADRADAAACLGRAPLPSEPERTPARRRADALVEMARRSAALGVDARFPAPLVSVMVDFPTIAGRICELANGTVVTPGSLLPYLDEALIERAVWKSPTRVEVGAKARLFSGATRRAIELRDRICQHPFCDVPMDRCQVDHIVPASQDGPTTQENGRLLCNWHNRLRNTVPELPEVPGRRGGLGGHGTPPAEDDEGPPHPPVPGKARRHPHEEDLTLLDALAGGGR
jgi:hypothetical protein